ncbi:hypothetical protein PYW49_04945 [Enterobacter sp. 170198]|uniref:DUF4760 domain-containing protein n=1 Tax=Enterobacter chinensis TaxID=3030997 RepID=A0ABU5CZ60_9ENTR|nr:hypothetical protein [Enterobacter sp. 170198]MDY0417020.1 hypothetical protein [Enterobacter sp. 170198]
MVCRKTNIILISIVGVLLIIAILVLIKVLFADVKGFEWGSFTDWLSAVGTFGTFIIAIIALMKVPDWMAQKHYDIAYTIIENAVYKDLSDIRTISFRAKNTVLALTKKIVEAVRIDGNDVKIKSHIDELNQELENKNDEYHRLSYGIINQFKSISRTNYDISEHTSEIENFVQKTTKEYDDIFTRIYIALGEYESLYFADKIAKDTFEKEINDIRHAAVKNNKQLLDKINKVYSQNLPIKNFINRKKK